MQQDVKRPVVERSETPGFRCAQPPGVSTCILRLITILTLLSAADSALSVPTQLEPPRLLHDRLLDDLGPAAAGEERNPLLEITQKMRQVQMLIGQADSGGKTQRQQREIIAELDKLIEQARRCCRQSQPSADDSRQTTSRRPVDQPKRKPAIGGRKPGTQPAQTADAKSGQAGAKRPDMGQMRDILKSLWGELPQRARKQMLQLPVEQFLPRYELMIERYFKRLAEEKGKDGR